MDELNPLAFPSYSSQPSLSSQQPIKIKHNYHLAPQYELALELRLDGLSYETIKGELKKAGFYYTEGTIRQWFAIHGQPSIKSIYDEITEIRTKEALAEYSKARETLSKDVPEAMAILHRGIRDKYISKIQLETAREILDRAGFGRQVKQDGNLHVESEGISRIAEAMKKIAERAV